MIDRHEATDANKNIFSTDSSDDRCLFLVNDNPAFARLVEALIHNTKGLVCEPHHPEDLARAVTARRPDLLLVMENPDLYRSLRTTNYFKEIPLLYLLIGEADRSKIPTLADGDQCWTLKNDSYEFRNVIRQIIPDRQGKCILCVDDSPTILNQIARAFVGTPYQVVRASNGREALDLLPQYKPDLILTDIEMPVMDGLTFCREVRKRPDSAEIPLIILSSLLDYQTIAKGFDSGADEYLTKPFFPDEILNKAESYLVPPPNRRQERILVVSDGPNVTHVLRLALEQQGFKVDVAPRTDAAIALIEQENPDMVIADADLQDCSGYQICARVRERTEFRRMPFVIATEKTSSGARKLGKKVGVTAYLTKPFTREGAVMLVERLLAERRSLTALERDMVLASITSLAKALDERDPYTRFHSGNVSQYAMAIARKAGFNLDQLENIRLAGLLHDIGKIGVPDQILHKPGRLTESEFEKVKEHAVRGAEILQPIPSLEEIIPGILHHHERMDGKGYPSGLRGENIPELAQILAVADTYDALVTDRPYRAGLSKENALVILKEAAGAQLSPFYVELFLEWLSGQADGE